MARAKSPKKLLDRPISGVKPPYDQRADDAPVITQRRVTVTVTHTSEFRRVVNGTPTELDLRLCRCNRVKRLKALGNGICPPQAALAITILLSRIPE